MIQPYYDDGQITIYRGDCREVLPALVPGSVDLILTDPPYGDVTHEGARSVTSTRALIDFASTTSEAIRDLLTTHAAVCRAWYFATMEWRHIADLERNPPEGWRFVRFGIWVKPNGAPQFTGDRPGTGWEGVAILHRDNGRMQWNGGGHHGVWTHPKISGAHPTEKPEPLVREWIRQFSNPGDLILDPFMGSGTVLRCAKDMGRRAIGVELEERYCLHAVRRLQQSVLNLDGAA